MLARCFVDTKSKNVYHVIRCVEKGQFVKAEPAFTPPKKKKDCLSGFQAEHRWGTI